MSLLSISGSGVNCAQTAINVICDNISNSMNPDYCRKSVVIASSRGENLTTGVISGGAIVEDTVRINDVFINRMERQAISQHSNVERSSQLMSLLDKITTPSSKETIDSIDNIFDKLQMINPSQNEHAPRTEAFNQLKSWCETVKNYDDKLEGIKWSVNNFTMQTIDNINALTKDVAILNREIKHCHTNYKRLPSNLLDQRERAINSLSACIGIEIEENTNTGEMNIRLAKGYTLVSGAEAYALQTIVSENDSSQLDIYYKNKQSENILLSKDDFKSGRLEANLTFSCDYLTKISNALNKMCGEFSSKFNAINTAGYDHDGIKGGDIFAHSESIKSLVLNISSGDQLALSSVGVEHEKSSQDNGGNEGFSRTGSGEYERDNINLKSFIKIQNEELRDNNGIISRIIDLTRSIGSAGQSLKDDLSINSETLSKISHQRKSFQGVNIDEENLNLTYFTRYYQANLRAIQSAQSTIDSLLRLV